MGRNSCCIVLAAAFVVGVATSRLLVEREIIGEMIFVGLYIYIEKLLNEVICFSKQFYK